MNLNSIIHKASDNYCYALNENDICINLKTGYDIKKIIIYSGDPFSNGIMGGNNTAKVLPTEITEKIELENHLLWKITITPAFKRLTYYFLIEDFEGNKMYMLENRFFTPREFEKYSGRLQQFYFPWINPSDVIKTPTWVNNTIWYQIFIDRFCNGNPELNPKSVNPWPKSSKKVSYKDFYGGDLPGITSKLDYLSSLGITGLYLTPICKGKSNHKYDTVSYTKIDPHFGNDEDMKNLVSEAHNRGIKVMMDGVFNHSSNFFAPWRDVQKKGPDSKYYDWFMINKWPFSERNDNAKKGRYYSFAFYDGMPKLNTNNENVRKYIIKVCISWIKKYDIDGLRLDVASEISHTLCKQLRQALKKVKPDFYILGEIWHDSTPWLRGDEFDSVMNYMFSDAINDFWTNKEADSKSFEHSINYCFSLYPDQINNALFNLLDSHDTIRLVSKLNNKNHFLQQLAILLTMPGSPCIYYGTELALEGGYDPDCRRCMPWFEINNGKYAEEISNIQNLIALRNSHPALRGVKYRFTHYQNNPRIIQYTRYPDLKNSSTEKPVTVIINCSDTDFTPIVENKKILFSHRFNEGKLLPDSILILS